jgi:DNA-binding beta-propeller fold protein YncE
VFGAAAGSASAYRGLVGSWPAAAPTGIPYSIQSLASDGTRTVYAIRQGQVEKYDLQGHLLGQWGPSGAPDTRFAVSSDIAVDSQGAVFVADATEDGAVYKFSPDGQLLAKWPSNQPSGVAPASDGSVYVSQAMGIDRFSASGELLSHRPVGGYRSLSQLTFGPGGALYAIAGRFVVRLDAGGGFSGGWNGFSEFGPRDLAFDSDGSLWASDTNNYRIVQLGAAGEFIGVCGPDNGYLSAPWGIAAVGRDLFVGSNERVERIGDVSPPTPACDGFPYLVDLRVTPVRFSPRAGRRARITFSFGSSERGRVVIAISREITVACRPRRPARCQRLVRVATLRAGLNAGRKRVSFNGRVGGHILPRGRYRAVAKVTSSPLPIRGIDPRTSKPATVTFRVV